MIISVLMEADRFIFTFIEPVTGESPQILLSLKDWDLPRQGMLPSEIRTDSVL